MPRKNKQYSTGLVRSCTPAIMIWFQRVACQIPVTGYYSIRSIRNGGARAAVHYYGYKVLVSFTLSTFAQELSTNHSAVGTGKTFLTSKVIDDQRALLDSGPNDEAIAFFYFNRSELSRSSALACLRSLVRQFSTCHTGHGRIQPTLRNLYNSCRRDARTLSKELCKKQLAESLKLFPRSILVLDALDECLHESDRLELVMTLKALMEESPRPFQVFISGRPNGDIRDALRGCTSVEIKVDDNKDDIAKFVNEKVKNHRGWRDFSQETKKTVIDTLIAKGQAMSVPLKALSCSLPGLVLTHQSESALGFAGYIFKFTSCQRDAWSRKYFFDFNSCPKTLKPHTQKYTHSRSRPVARLSQGSPNVPSCGLWRL